MQKLALVLFFLCCAVKAESTDLFSILGKEGKVLLRVTSNGNAIQTSTSDELKEALTSIAKANEEYLKQRVPVPAMPIPYGVEVVQPNKQYSAKQLPAPLFEKEK